jgi:NAD(P)-dependent dehydrogenase (short-subunit alcohol dehydrogenase family)
MTDNEKTTKNCCLFGANGGIGAAILNQWQHDPHVGSIHAGARSSDAGGPKTAPFAFDLTEEASIAAAANNIGVSGPIDTVFVATGMLHSDAILPEKSLRAQSAESYAHAFAINTIGPALIAKHFLPLLPRDRRSVFAVLSARVSSISDNRIGGWHAYRASKAALNMAIRNFAIEMARTHPQAIVVALHPGTVDTKLSRPFQRGVTPEKLFTPEFSAQRMLAVLDTLTPVDSGNLFAWDGQRIDF